VNVAPSILFEPKFFWRKQEKGAGKQSIALFLSTHRNQDDRGVKRFFLDGRGAFGGNITAPMNKKKAPMAKELLPEEKAAGEKVISSEVPRVR